MSSYSRADDLIERVRARLRGAGVPDERIPALLDRATPLLACLDAIADLDSELPEPALTWQPVEEVSR